MGSERGVRAIHLCGWIAAWISLGTSLRMQGVCLVGDILHLHRSVLTVAVGRGP
jgi:hypothetical protein